MPCLGLSHTKKPASYPDCELAFFVYWGQAQVYHDNILFLTPFEKDEPFR